MRFFLSLLSFNLLVACAPAVQPMTPSATPGIIRTSATETEKRLDAFIAAKTKRLAGPLIDALKRYHYQKGVYPASLDELVTAGLLTQVKSDFDVTDFDAPHDPEIERFVFVDGQPRLYRFDYKPDTDAYRLGLGYTVLDVVRLEYASGAADWKEMRAF